MNANILNIAVLPLDIVKADKEANLKAVAAALPSLYKDTDIMILPELFSTGFVDDREQISELAEPLSGPTLEFIHNIAAHYNIAVCGSYLASVAGLYYNRGFFIEPSGEETFYDKHHLFCLSPESRLMQKGRRPAPVIRYRGWNLALALCYDLRFPVWCRNRQLAYDAMLLPANWPQARIYAWEHLLIARAIENQAYYVGGNRSGCDAYGDYNNTTRIYDPSGNPIAEADGLFLYARLDAETLATARKRFPAWRDADNWTLSDDVTQ